MTNEERQRAIEWMKGRPVMMAGAKRMYDLAVEAMEAYVPDMNDGNMEPSRESNTEITRCSDDTISRQAAVEALEAKKDKSAKGDMGCFYNTIIQNDIDALKGLPSAQPEQRWIPVSERLPEDGTEVFVYLFNNPKSPYVAWIEDSRWYTEEFEVDREYEPLAWMPLPTPYREE